MAAPTPELTNREILKLAEGLAGLDGCVGDGGKVTRFKFDAETAWRVALDTEIVGRAKLAYERRLKQLGAEHGVVEGMGLTPANAAAVAAYIAAQDALLDQKQPVTGLHTYQRSVLQEKNPIPPSVLAALLPLLEDA